MPAARLLAFSTALLLLACSSDPAPAEGSAGAAGSAGAGGSSPSVCAKDNRAQTFAQGLEAKSDKGTHTLRLLTIDPDPVFKGNNAWKLQIVDAAGAPVDGLDVSVKPFMPDHNHGSSIVPTVTPVGSDGRYDVTLLNLFMPGLWQVIFTVQSPGQTEQATFSSCVTG